MELSKLKDKNNFFYGVYILKRYFNMKKKERYAKSLNEIERKKYIEKNYYERFGKLLDWDSLEEYTEKMQLYKLDESTPIKTQLTDKLEVRNWVSEKIGNEYLIPLLGAWDTFNGIDFSELPSQFVLKTNNASNSNIIVKNKDDLNKFRAKLFLNMWLSVNFAYTTGFQMQYKNIKSKIIAEKYIVDKNDQLNDYKFLCFNGEVYYCWVDVDRYGERRRNIYDTEWNLQPWNQSHYVNSDEEIQKPKNFSKMIEIAKVLCEGFSHVRVDLYNVDGKIYFGEMTFTSGNGFSAISPEEYNLEIGKIWNL